MTDVIIDAVLLNGSAAHSGIGTYIRQLLEGLGGIPDLSVTALATPATALPPTVDIACAHRLLRRGRPSVWEHETRRAVDWRIHRGDVFHNPSPHAPIFPPSPWVQTLYDVIPLVSDDPALANLKRRFARFGPRYCRADAVVAISRHAADEGVRELGIDMKRLHVIHPGVGAEFTPGPSVPTSDPPYISVVSEFSARKGFAESFSVIAALAEMGYPHRLVVAGTIPFRARSLFDVTVATAPRPDRIDILGYVNDLVSLYRGAAVHLITSRYEGFGLTAVEAMACGTPVVAFANSSLIEVVRDAGILVADGDVSAAAAAVRAIIDEPDFRLELREKGLTRAAEFDWQQGASAHAEVYKQLASA